MPVLMREEAGYSPEIATIEALSAGFSLPVTALSRLADLACTN
jgi:hypothetical protein